MTSSKDLRLIAQHLLRIADAENDQTDAVETRKRRSGPDLVESADPDSLAELAEALYRLRQTRAERFPQELFGEPSWDILLDLYVAKARGKRVSITSACVASGVPPTTALRWIALLEDDGWIVREDDQLDRRRHYVRLTPHGERQLALWLVSASERIRTVRRLVPQYKRITL